MSLFFFSSSAVDNRVVKSYYELFLKCYVGNCLIFLVCSLHVLRHFVGKVSINGRTETDNRIFWVFSVWQIAYGVLFAFTEIWNFFYQPIFHLFCHHYKIKLPKLRQLVLQSIVFGLFTGLFSNLSVIFAAVCLKNTRETVLTSLPLASLIWTGTMAIKVIYELVMLFYFCDRHMLYVNVAVSEIMYFSSSLIMTTSIRITFLLQSRFGVSIGGTMLLVIEAVIFVSMVIRSLKKLRDNRDTDKNVERIPAMNRVVILQIANMQASSCISLITPFIAMGMMIMCKNSSYHSDFVDDIEWIQNDDYAEMLIIIATQIGPSILLDLIKYCALRHLGLDLMAFWKTQNDIRLALGKTCGCLFSSVVVMLLLMNSGDWAHDIIYDTQVVTR